MTGQIPRNKQLRIYTSIQTRPLRLLSPPLRLLLVALTWLLHLPLLHLLQPEQEEESQRASTLATLHYPYSYQARTHQILLRGLYITQTKCESRHPCQESREADHRYRFCSQTIVPISRSCFVPALCYCYHQALSIHCELQRSVKIVPRFAKTPHPGPCSR